MISLKLQGRGFLPMLLIWAAWIYADILNDEVAVIINENSAESRLIGRHYQKLRSIIPGNMIFLRVTDKVSISRELYQEKIFSRVNQALRETASAKVKYLVTTRGMPLWIRTSKPASARHLIGRYETDVATLESELMNAKKSFSFYSGWKKRKSSNSSLDAVNDLTVMRLDAPTAGEVIRYLDYIVTAEDSALKGDWVFDSRGKGVSDPHSMKMDKLILSIGKLIRRHDKSLPVILDSLESPFVQSRTEIAIHLGQSWPKNTYPKINRGALLVRSDCIDSHRVDISGPCVRGMRWAGVGYSQWAVQPTLVAAYPKPHIFLAVLFYGKTLGEALSSALGYSSWVVTFAGDPMYAPFKAAPLPTELIQELRSLSDD